ncbi:hypothetical protein [Agrobacterium vitis]|uniref:hypothetical protein n=1 Tax=Agrobacterium vitis TaxID=373 RepID=UPI0015728364|nr:hypothetical protein [Agrobacterium vitis]NSZ17092.1 hypothetical protein [Agrobacterium vitis]QZO02832.1 hypothetical protein K4831_10130 [Agrobacterium vitis]UJL87957.1 hypothetical protein AVF2S5_08470 [Agrobacterium vitis]
MNVSDFSQHRFAPSLIAAAIICLGPVSVSLANSITVAQALAVCRSTSVEEARQKGDQLGWPRMPEDKNWKSSYESYNKVTVDVVGWWDEEAGSRLSFWVATGVNPGRACSYSLTNNDSLLADLKVELGKPENEDHNEISDNAYWQRPGAEIYFTKVGSSSGFTMGVK